MRNGTRQNATDQTLRPAQARVIAEIAQGRTITAATRAAGVDRSTYYRWEKSDPCFAAALFQAQVAYADDLKAQVRDLAPQAVAAIREILTSQEVPPAIRLKAATEVLTVAGGLGREELSGNTDPEECELLIENDKIRRAQVLAGIAESREFVFSRVRRLAGRP